MANSSKVVASLLREVKARESFFEVAAPCGDLVQATFLTTTFPAHLSISQASRFAQAPNENMLNLLYESHPAETQVDGLPRAASLFSTSLVGIKVVMEAPFFMVAPKISIFWLIFVEVFHS